MFKRIWDKVKTFLSFLPILGIVFEAFLNKEKEREELDVISKAKSDFIRDTNIIAAKYNKLRSDETPTSIDFAKGTSSSNISKVRKRNL